MTLPPSLIFSPPNCNSNSNSNPNIIKTSMSMWWDLGLQALFFLTGILMFLWTNNIPQKLLAKYNSFRNRSKHLARKHFVKAASLLSQARSHPPSSPLFIAAANAAVAEADAAVRLDPSDAAHHIVRALALDLQGFKTSALESLDFALSPLAVRSLSDEEKADAMAKRAELRMEVSRLGDSVDESVWNVVEMELRDAVVLKPGSAKAWCLIGKCCEELGKKEKAREAFEEAIRVESHSVLARQGLDRLGS